MMLPNKTISYDNSVKAGLLYKSLKKEFSSIHVFIQTLDSLFALGKIKFNENEEIALC